ncbi:hypothetical protein E2986_11470 [Frieseomelitta varia]|uniref:Uncharacterized protein n=1 Tax=Frieseomelitta varia TaxID=561572 RepID=A0A833S528_9HYME|nr:hypothetical protein E2986_11470 [Frieseomelitta varia]
MPTVSSTSTTAELYHHDVCTCYTFLWWLLFVVSSFAVTSKEKPGTTIHVTELGELLLFVTAKPYLKPYNEIMNPFTINLKSTDNESTPLKITAGMYITKEIRLHALDCSTRQ